MNKAEQTRQLIVERIAPIFNVKGYAGTSVSDIEKATGLSKGSVYGNFANKEEVALAAFEHNWNRVRAGVRAAMDKRKSSKDKLLALAGFYQDVQPHAFPEGGCPLLNTAVEADDNHPALRKKATEAFQAWKKNIVAVVESGMAAKEFRSGIDAEQVAVTLIAMIEGAIMLSRLTGNAKYRKTVMPAVEKAILDLV